MANRNIKTKSNKELNQYIVVLENSVKSMKKKHKILEDKVNKILTKVNDDTKEVESKEFTCNQCSTILKDKSDLKLHIKSIHSKKKEIMCKECFKSFKENHELENY